MVQRVFQFGVSCGYQVGFRQLNAGCFGTGQVSLPSLLLALVEAHSLNLKLNLFIPAPYCPPHAAPAACDLCLCQARLALSRLPSAVHRVQWCWRLQLQGGQACVLAGGGRGRPGGACCSNCIHRHAACPAVDLLRHCSYNMLTLGALLQDRLRRAYSGVPVIWRSNVVVPLSAPLPAVTAEAALDDLPEEGGAEAYDQPAGGHFQRRMRPGGLAVQGAALHNHVTLGCEGDTLARVRLIPKETGGPLTAMGACSLPANPFFPVRSGNWCV